MGEAWDVMRDPRSGHVFVAGRPQIAARRSSRLGGGGGTAPVTPPVLLATGALLSAHLLLGLAIFRLSFWRTLLSLLVSLAAGIGIFLLFLQRND